MRIVGETSFIRERDGKSALWLYREFTVKRLRDQAAVLDIPRDEIVVTEEGEVVGISIWDSPESRERFRLSEVEAERRRLMAPFVIEERAGFYTGRELRIPER